MPQICKVSTWLGKPLSRKMVICIRYHHRHTLDEKLIGKPKYHKRKILRNKQINEEKEKP